MNRTFLAALLVAVLTSCAESYNIHGTTSVSMLDGSKLYLKAFKGGKVQNIDSCEVVHGEFRFAGLLDSVRVANLFLDDRSLNMPIVLEQGDITIRIDETSRRVSGTELNETLYDFFTAHDQLVGELEDLDHQYTQALLEGEEESTINQRLTALAYEIHAREDSLVTGFISENFDNVLGPEVFITMCTRGMRFPVLTPQIEHIMTQATDKFKNNPIVKEFYQAASENEARMQGLIDDAPAASTTPASAPADSLQKK